MEVIWLTLGVPRLSMGNRQGATENP